MSDNPQNQNLDKSQIPKEQYLKELNAKLERDYQRGLKRASDNAWKGILTYFNL